MNLDSAGIVEGGFADDNKIEDLSNGTVTTRAATSFSNPVLWEEYV